MKRKLKNRILVLCACVVGVVQLSYAQLASPFNQKQLNDSAGEYTFLVGGHFHGASTNRSGFPASTLLAGIDTLNALHPAFMISLGDVFPDMNESILENYEKSLFSKLEMPLFNAVGNHDLSNGNKYEDLFGRTFFWFAKQSEIFIILNTETDDGSIKSGQLKMLNEALEAAKGDSIRNVFVFSHRPVWAEEGKRYEQLFRGNTRSSFGVPNFKNEVKPLIEQLNKPVYWMSGSMAGGPSSFFYDKEGAGKLVYMQTAIRDLPRDAVLQVKVREGKVALKGISLTGQQLKPVEEYNIDYWKKAVPEEEKFSFRLLPLLIKNMLSHHYFWTGLALGILLLLLALTMNKRWKRRK